MGDTDHRLVQSKLRLRVKLQCRRTAGWPSLNINALQNNQKKRQLQAIYSGKLPRGPFACHNTEQLTDQWKRISNALLDEANVVLGTTKKKNCDRFNKQDNGIQILFNERN